jgi:hypothetical protein
MEGDGERPGGGVAARTEDEAPAEAFVESRARLIALANGGTVPSGILLTSRWTYASFPRFDGEVVFRHVSQQTWEQHYHDLQRSAVPDAPPSARLPPLETLLARAEALAAGGVTPIAVANVHFHAPTRAFVGEVMEAEREGRAIEPPGDLATAIEPRRAFLASALLPHVCVSFNLLPPVHRGRRVKLVLEREAYLTNDPVLPTRLELDPHDGRPPRAIELDEVVEVEYPTPGLKQVRLRAIFGDRALRGVFAFRVEEAAAPPKVDFVFPLVADIPYEGVKGAGLASVFLGSDHGVKHPDVVKPVIVADGFSCNSQVYEANRLAEGLDQQRLFTEILAGGYDVVLLTYYVGTDYIQRNAFVLVKCIQEVLKYRRSTEPLIVAGASMGGVVARYALAYMERNGIDHQTSTFLSFDSPQQGAIVPPGDQWLLYLFASKGNCNAKEVVERLLSTPAARQMLYYNAITYEQTDQLVDPLHTKLYFQDLRKLGYPRRTRNVGVADGAGSGVRVVPGEAQLIDTDDFCLSARSWSLTDGVPNTKLGDAHVGSHTYRFIVSGTRPYDGVEGGQTDTNEVLAKAINAAGYETKYWYPRTCFIPTISALDVRDVDINAPVPPHGAPSNFHSYFVSTCNHPHVEVSLEIKAFVLREVAGHYQPPPLQMLIGGLTFFGANLHAAAGRNDELWFGPTDPLLGSLQTLYQPAVAAMGQALYMAVARGNGLPIYATKSPDGVVWAEPSGPIVGDFRVNAPPSMAAKEGTLYLALPGVDERLYIASSRDGVRWEQLGNGPILPNRIVSTPALVAKGKRLHLAWEQDRAVYTSSSADGATWSQPAGPAVPNFQTAVPPAMAVLNGTLYMALTGLDRGLYVARSMNGVRWELLSHKPVVKDLRLELTAGLTSLGNRLYLAWPSLDLRIYTLSSTDGLDWTKPHGPLFDGWVVPFSPVIVALAEASH